MRETQQMSEEQLSENSGVSLKIVKAIENGDVVPSLTINQNFKSIRCKTWNILR